MICLEMPSSSLSKAGQRRGFSSVQGMDAPLSRNRSLLVAFPGSGGPNGGAFEALPDGRVPLSDLRPVDGVPPRVDVVGAPVLVFEVVRVLPDVDAEEGRLAVRDGVVLVGRGDHGEPRAVVDQPGPAGAELVDAGV